LCVAPGEDARIGRGSDHLGDDVRVQQKSRTTIRLGERRCPGSRTLRLRKIDAADRREPPGDPRPEAFRRALRRYSAAQRLPG
jgi:hypothetical protein